MTKKKKNTEKTKAFIMDKIIAKKEIVSVIVGGLTAMYPIINFIYNVFYQSKCEKFYGVPGKYFHSTINNRLLYLGCILILMTILQMAHHIGQFCGAKRSRCVAERSDVVRF